MALEIIGYIGMVTVLCSCLMKDMWKLRVVNLAGAIMNLTYGIGRNVIPNAILNGCIMIIDIVYIVILFRKKHPKVKKEAKTESECCGYYDEDGYFNITVSYSVEKFIAC